MSRTALTALLISAAGPTGVAGLARAMTLTDAVHRAWAHAPQLAAQAGLNGLADQDAKRRLLPNEPQATFTRSDDGASQAVGLSLTIGVPGKAFALRGLDQAKSDSQRLELLAKRHDLAKTAAQAFLDCATQRALADLQRAAVQDQEDLAQALKQMYDAGRAAQAETIGADLQVRQARSDLRALTDHAAVACRKLHDLAPASADPHEAYPLPEDLEPALLAELGSATADELRGRGTVQVSDATATTATWSQVPDLTLSAQRNHYLTAGPAGKDWTTTLSVGMTLPILYGTYEGAEARRTRGQAAVDRGTAEAALLAARSDVDDAAQDFARSRARLAETKDHDLPLAEALYESTIAAYKSGKLGYAELVLARKTLSDLKSQQVQLKGGIIGARLRCLSRCDALAPRDTDG